MVPCHQYGGVMLQAKALPINRHDYEEMPAGPPYYQVIEGDLVMSPSPNIYHQALVGRIYSLLLQFLEKKPLGEVFVAPLDVFLSEINVYQPDVIFISNQRRSILTEHGLEGAPDLAVEVLSPGTARFDKGSKRKVYARAGVQELWLVDPDAKLIHVYQLAKDAETPAATYDEKAVFTSPRLPGLRLKAASIFKSPLRK
jgi:Uma2 family endonuclease